MNMVGPKKRRPSILAKTIKKPIYNEKSFNQSGSKSFFNRSTNSYVLELRKKNTRLARALTSQKLTCMSLFNRLNCNESKYLEQQASLRKMYQKVKDCVSNLKTLSETVISGFYNFSSSLVSISNELGALAPEVLTGIVDETQIDEVSADNCTSLPKCEEPQSSGGNTIHNRNGLSPLLEESIENAESSSRKSLGSPVCCRTMEIPTSCVMLQRIDQRPDITLALEDENSPKITELDLNSDRFEGIHYSNDKNLSQMNLSSDEEDLQTRLANFNKKPFPSAEDDPKEGTSWDFDEFGNSTNRATKKLKKKKSALMKKKDQSRFQLPQPAVKSVPEAPANIKRTCALSSTICDEIDMSLTVCIPSTISLNEVQSSSFSKDLNHEETTLKCIPIVQLEKLDETKHLNELSSVNDSKPNSTASLVSGNLCINERKMYVTHRSRKDQHSLERCDSLPLMKSVPVIKLTACSPSIDNISSRRDVTSSDMGQDSQQSNGLNCSNLHQNTSYVVLQRLSSNTSEKDHKKRKVSGKRSSSPRSHQGDPVYTDFSPLSHTGFETNVCANSGNVSLDAQSLEVSSLPVKKSEDSKITTHSDVKTKKASEDKMKIKAKSKSVGTSSKRQKGDRARGSSGQEGSSSAPSSPIQSSHAYSSDSESSTCSEASNRPRRARTPLSYKEPPLHKKMRRE